MDLNGEVPVEIPINFPYNATDEAIRLKLEELTRNIVTTRQDGFANKYSALAQLGLIELQNRANDRNSEFTRSTYLFSKRSTFFSISLSFVAILFSFTAIYYARKDDVADAEWEANQLKSYNSMIVEFKDLNHKVDSLTKIANRWSPTVKLNKGTLISSQMILSLHNIRQ